MGSEHGGPGAWEVRKEASFEVPATASRRAGEFAVGVLMALFCLMSVFPPSGEYFLPWLMAPFGAIASLHFFRRVFDGRPRLVVDEEGIVDRTALIGGELRLPWAEILSVSASGLRNTVDLTVRDPPTLGRMCGFWRRVGLRLGRLIGRRSVSINLTLLGFTKGKLKERLDDGLLRFERTQLGLGRHSQLPPGRTTPGRSEPGLVQGPGRERDEEINT